MGEFGRTPKINGKAGRDHWPFCFSAVLAGGGVRRGAPRRQRQARRLSRPRRSDARRSRRNTLLAVRPRPRPRSATAPTALTGSRRGNPCEHSSRADGRRMGHGEPSPGHDCDCVMDPSGYNSPRQLVLTIHSHSTVEPSARHIKGGSRGGSVRRNEMPEVLSAPSAVGKRKASPRIPLDERAVKVDVAGPILLFLVGLAMAAWCLITCGRLNLPGAFFFLLYPWTVDRTGRLVTPWLGVEPALGRSFPFRFLVGFTVLTLAQFLAHTLLPGSLAAPFPDLRRTRRNGVVPAPAPGNRDGSSNIRPRPGPRCSWWSCVCWRHMLVARAPCLGRCPG